MNNKIKTIHIIALIVIIIISVLAFLFYYYSVKLVPQTSQVSTPVATAPAEKPAVIPTNVIAFLPPDVLPKTQQNGSCWTNSISSLRQDAWRCMIGNEINDPCFSTKQKGLVFCPMNPTESNSVLIKLTKDLPKPSTVISTQDNWAWFLVLEDGTYCSPFTGTRPFFNQGKDVAYYSCNSNDKTKQIVLLGDLTKDIVWKANEAILSQTGNNWDISSTKQVNIKTIWQ